MEEKRYKVQEIFEWFKQFDKEEIKILGESKSFELILKNRNLPHLLGLQYINNIEKIKYIKGQELYNYIKNKNFSDQDIFKLIEEKNKNFLSAAKDRIDSLKKFLENLEDGIIVERTYYTEKTKIKSNFLIVQTNEDYIYHLGINQGKIEDSIEEFNVLKRGNSSNTYLETYFIRDDKKYFENSKIAEKIKGLYRYNEEIEKYEEFTFKHNYENKIVNKKKKNQEKELER